MEKAKDFGDRLVRHDNTVLVKTKNDVGILIRRNSLPNIFSQLDANRAPIDRSRSLRHMKQNRRPYPGTSVISSQPGQGVTVQSEQSDFNPSDASRVESNEPSTSQILRNDLNRGFPLRRPILEQLLADQELMDILHLGRRVNLDLVDGNLGLVDFDLSDSDESIDSDFLFPDSNLGDLLHPLDDSFRRGVKRIAICQVCYEELMLWERSCCQITVCDTCLSTYIQTEIEDNGHISIECVSDSCRVPLAVDEITFLINNDELRQKYARYRQNANSQPNKRTCPQCCFLTEIDPKDLEMKYIRKYGKRIECTQCSYVWCYSCHAPAHPEIKCRKAQKGNKALKEWAKEYGYGQKNARKCPGCKIFIQRNKGCDHMTCKNCNTQFCYKCGNRHRNVKFLGSHYDRFSIFGCPFNLFNGRRKHLRRFIRGSIFAGKLFAIPIALALAIAALPLAVVALIFGGPVYGFVRLHRYRCQQRARQAVLALKERARRIRELEMENGDFPRDLFVRHFQLEARSAIAEEF